MTLFAFGGIFLGAVSVLSVYFPTAWLYEQWGWVGAGAFWSAWLVWMVGFLMWGARLERRAKNPLLRLLDTEGAPEVKYRGLRRGRLGPLKGTPPFVRKRGR